MNRLRLVRCSLWHFRRTHAGILAGALVATATLVGALVVGDSVRHTLALAARARIGEADAVLRAGDRFFRAALADGLARDGRRVAPAIELPGVVSSGDGTRRLREVRVLGVDERFFDLAPAGAPPAPPADGHALANAALARGLGLAPGDSFVLRVERPSALPRDMALSTDDVAVALRLELDAVLGDDAFGGFSLVATNTPPANLFLPLAWLQAELGVAGRANLLLAGLGGEALDAAALAGAVEGLQADLRGAWSLDDAELHLRPLEGRARAELSTARVFFDAPVIDVLERAAREEALALTGIFTYFVNGLAHGERSTPYSMVSAVDRLGPAPPGAPPPAWRSVAPADLGPDGLVAGRWLADDLGLAPGDPVTLSYYVVEGSQRLTERERTFRVHAIVPLEGWAADPTLMPAFPGLADAEDCRDWEPGTPVDLDRIRDEDEAYWDAHRGTPKAFVSMEAAREMWGGRFGELTAVRLPADRAERLEDALTRDLDPARLGLFFRDVRSGARASADSPTDFGGLFLGLSFFLIVAALLLATQLFLFGVEARASELGILGAVGFPRALVRQLFLGEAMVLALLGAVLGAFAGLGYTRLVLWGLSSVWSDAVARVALTFHARPVTVLGGAGGAALAMLASVAWTLRAKLRTPLAALLVQRAGVVAEPVAGRRAALLPWVLFGLALAGALVTALTVDASSGPEAAGAFFGAGALVLVAGLFLCRGGFRGRLHARAHPVRSIAGLGLGNTRRRPGRSLATVALIAIGTFLIVSIGAFQQGPLQDPGRRDAGTGGFRFVGRSSLPVLHDLGEPRGREAFALDEDEMRGVGVVSLKVRAGDEASCLNLARAERPQLLGVEPEQLATRDAFPFADHIPTQEGEHPWMLLERVLEDGAVPAIGDAVSLQWQLHKGLGDTLDYVDERGRPVTVRLVGAVADTVLQGDLLISAESFRRLYPSDGGYRRFLVDAPAERAAEVSADLTRALADVGLALEDASARLEAFHSVQNSYLAIFQVLGAIGLLLGSVGLGMVVLRNTLERRGELALVSALGYRARQVRWWLVSEYGALLSSGLGVGALASALAVLPAARAPGRDLSLGSAGILVGAVAVNGLFWILLAARAARARAPLSALGEE